MKSFSLLAVAGLFLSATAFAQFNPVAVSGFNHDVVAETGTSSLTTTTIQMDGASSNKVMYTSAFATANSFTGGGLPNSGTIVSGPATFQMAAFTASNGLLIPRAGNGDIIFNTPASYSSLRVLFTATEGTALVTPTVFFTDGTSITGANFSISDWFNGTTNVVLQGFGRCTRATPAGGADAFPDNPRMYFQDLTIPCASRGKQIQRINFANVTTAGTNAPFPNLFVFAVSGMAYNQTITPAITNATCNNGGSITLTITGNTGPYTITYNTQPSQSGTSATNLAPGNYVATIINEQACTTTLPFTITLTNNLTLTLPQDPAICSGGSVAVNAQTNAANVSWSPTTGVSNPNSANVVLSPAGTQTYTVTGSTGPCTVVRTFTVTVVPPITVSAGADKTITAGGSVMLDGSASQGTYTWTPATGLIATNILTPIASPPATTIYRLTVTAGPGNLCSAFDEVTVFVNSAPQPPPPVITSCVNPMNAISPNGDGVNDRWLAFTAGCLTNVNAKIYNRYGNLIYSSDNYQNDWEGTYKGDPVPDGTYYYVLTYGSGAGKRIVKGDLTVLR